MATLRHCPCPWTMEITVNWAAVRHRPLRRLPRDRSKSRRIKEAGELYVFFVRRTLPRLSNTFNMCMVGLLFSLVSSAEPCVCVTKLVFLVFTPFFFVSLFSLSPNRSTHNELEKNR